ncbi:MAG: metallophosphoesterase [Clostridia bacterium]|nr:metallophosphoesterase [Clostridia bacterium]
MKRLECTDKTVAVPGLKDTVRILHVTDSHIVLTDEREEGFIIDDGPHKGKKLADFGKMRFDRFFIDGKSSAQRFAELCEAIGDDPDCADAVVFTGDIIDFFTPAAFEFMCENLKKITLPFMFVPGNHDMIFSKRSPDEMRRIFAPLCGGSTFVQKMKIGPLALIGIDNTDNFYHDEALEGLEKAMEGEENVVLFQHVPLSTDDLNRFTLSFQKKDWALGNNAICVGDSWRKIFSLIEAPDSKVRALICGDCHFDYSGPIGKATQFTSPLAAERPPVRFTFRG